MFRAILVISVLAWPSTARAQDMAPAMCPVMSAEIFKLVAGHVKGKGRCDTSCKGGPGYRQKVVGRKGECVAWANVVKECGKAPHDGCVRECVTAVPKCLDRVLGIAALIKLAAERGLPLELQPAEVPPEKPD
jgi:hypothetical protein